MGNYKLTPITLCPFGNVLLPDKVILNKQMAPKVVTLHTIYNPYVSKNLKREPATPSLSLWKEEVVYVDNFY